MNYAGISTILPPAAGTGTIVTGMAFGSGWIILTGAALMTVSLVTVSLFRLVRGERTLRAREAARNQAA